MDCKQISWDSKFNSNGFWCTKIFKGGLPLVPVLSLYRKRFQSTFFGAYSLTICRCSSSNTSHGNRSKFIQRIPNLKTMRHPHSAYLEHPISIVRNNVQQRFPILANKSLPMKFPSNICELRVTQTVTDRAQRYIKHSTKVCI